jgi:hypothetical protein
MIVRLPDGQYAGWSITVVPPAYLQWILRHRPLTPQLRRAICQELGRLKIDRSRPGYPRTLYEQRRRLPVKRRGRCCVQLNTTDGSDRERDQRLCVGGNV